MFDMTSRRAFEDVLDKWIKFLREIKYNNSIILFGTINYNNKKTTINSKNKYFQLQFKKAENVPSYIKMNVKEDKTLFQHIIAIIFTLIIMLMLHRALFILNLKSFFHKKENNNDN